MSTVLVSNITSVKHLPASGVGLGGRRRPAAPLAGGLGAGRRLAGDLRQVHLAALQARLDLAAAVAHGGGALEGGGRGGGPRLGPPRGERLAQVVEQPLA